MKFSWFIFFFFIGITHLYTQDLPAVIPPSPTAASLGEYGDIPVSQYTGIPSIRIPLYQIQSRDISLPISLSYHAGGVKVEEEASWVGLGWSLNAGGVITRSVRGLDDIPSSGYPFHGSVDMPSPDSENNYDPTTGSNDDLDYFSDLCNGIKDSEPDLFYFNFGGYSGKFILLPGSTVPLPSAGDPDVKVQLLSQNKIKIEALHHSYSAPPLNAMEARLDWKLTTPNGFVYYFRVQEITELKAGSGSSESEADDLSTVLSHPYTVNSWYLDQIVSPMGEVVSFTYEQDQHASLSVLSRTQTDVTLARVQLFRDCFGGGNCPFSSPPSSTGLTYSASQRITKDVYLERIDFQNGHIEFETSARDDIDKETSNHPDPQRLDQIHIYRKNNLERSFSFAYEYFNNSSSDVAQRRLKLMSLTELNGTSSKPAHEFTYYEDTDLEAKDSKNQDYWGYHNGADNDNLQFYHSDIISGLPPNPDVFSTLIPAYEHLTTTPPIYPGNYDAVDGYDQNCASQYCDPGSPQYDIQDCYDCWSDPLSPRYFHGANREADQTTNSIYLKAGTLKRITYPTGGYTELDYEPHDYSNFPSQDVWESNSRITGDSGPYSSSYPSSETIILSEPAFLLLDHYVVRICQGSCAPLPPSEPDHYGTLVGPGVNLQFRYDFLFDNTELEQYTYHYLEAGTYTLTSIASSDADVEIKASWSNPKVPQEPLLAKQGGGLRIKSIKTHDNISSSNDMERRYLYTKIEGGVEKSSGRLMSPLNHHYFREYSGQEASTWYIFHDLVLTSSSNIPLGSSATGNQVGYDEVTVLQGINGENGKSVYNYFNTEEQVSTPFFPICPQGSSTVMVSWALKHTTKRTPMEATRS